MFFYDYKGKDVYTFLTSGVGSGHPMNKYSIDENTITYTGGVVFIGIDGIKSYPGDNKKITKVTLYDMYLKNKAEFDQALLKIEKSNSFDLIKIIDDNLK